MAIEFSSYEQRLNFQEMRESLEDRCKNFWPDQVASLAHVITYNLRRTICAPDEPCGHIVLLKDANVLGPLLDVHLKPQQPAGNSEIALYYKTDDVAASQIFIPGRVLITPGAIPEGAMDADETANNTDRPLLIESSREGTIYGLAPSITSYASQGLFRKNYLAAIRKMGAVHDEFVNPPSTYSEFHKSLKFLHAEMFNKYGTGGRTNNPHLAKMPLPLDNKASALTWLINQMCKESGPLILHRGAKRRGRILGAEGQQDTLVVHYNTARDHERRSELHKEQFMPAAAYHYDPTIEESSITVVGKHKDMTVKYVIAPAKGAISKYGARRARLLEQVSSVCMDVDR